MIEYEESTPHSVLFTLFSQYFNRKQAASADPDCCYSTKRSVIFIAQHQILWSAECENCLFVGPRTTSLFCCITAVYALNPCRPAAGCAEFVQNFQTNDFKLVGMFTLARCASPYVSYALLCQGAPGDVSNCGYAVHHSSISVGQSKQQL